MSVAVVDRVVEVGVVLLDTAGAVENEAVFWESLAVAPTGA